MHIKCYNGQTKDKMGGACRTWKTREGNRGEERRYKDLIGKHEGMRPLVKPRHT